MTTTRESYSYTIYSLNRDGQITDEQAELLSNLLYTAQNLRTNLQRVAKDAAEAVERMANGYSASCTGTTVLSSQTVFDVETYNAKVQVYVAAAYTAGIALEYIQGAAKGE